MPDVGDRVVAQLQVVPPDGPADDTTIATLRVTSPTGVLSNPGPATADHGTTWLADVLYNEPGVWQLTWTVVGHGAGVQTQHVSVAPQDVYRGRSYATSADLADYLGEAPPAGADRLLRDASTMIDRLLISAVYDVDGNDFPTLPLYVNALRDAVCEQVNWWAQTGDPHGARAAFSSVRIGAVSLSGATGSGTGPRASTRIGPQVIAILENVGLLGQPPVTW